MNKSLYFVLSRVALSYDLDLCFIVFVSLLVVKTRNNFH